MILRSAQQASDFSLLPRPLSATLTRREPHDAGCETGDWLEYSMCSVSERLGSRRAHGANNFRVTPDPDDQPLHALFFYRMFACGPARPKQAFEATVCCLE